MSDRINRIGISIKNSEFIHKNLYRNLDNIGDMVSYYVDNGFLSGKNGERLLCSNFKCLNPIKEHFFTYDNLLYLHFCHINCLLEAHPELVNDI